VLILHLLRSGLWRSLDGEKLRFFFGLTPRLHLSRERPLCRAIPWGAALLSPRRAREIFVWLEYRIELFDGKAG
jgi:hypothetical protein